LNWFKYRPFDPQIGRGWQVDRLADQYVHNSPYAFSENKVTGHIELDGLEAVPVYPNPQAQLFKSAGFDHKLSQAETNDLGKKITILAAKATAMALAIVVPVEDAVLGTIGLLGKEFGFSAKIEATIAKETATFNKTASQELKLLPEWKPKGKINPIPQTKDGFQVTKDGVAFEKTSKTTIPSNYVENPNRSGNYGIIDTQTGKYMEKLRIDAATPLGKKGPANSHYHINNSKEHYSPNPNDKHPGFQ
jgi:hypothetical protein